MRLALAILVALMPVAAAAACRDNAVELRGDGASARFSIEIADDAAERAQGLMFRDALPRSAGMLFLYDQPQRLSFWMKNTLIPLDIVFFDAQGIVRHIHPNARPQDLTPIPGGDDLVAALEINGGLAARLGIEPGWQMRHPAMAQFSPVWACE